MGIKIDYTPYAELQSMATEAGAAQGRAAMIELKSREGMQKMQMEFQQKNMEFQKQARIEASAEDYERTLKMAQAKSDIDFQSDLQMYAQKRSQFMSDVSQIGESEFLNEDEKQKFKKKAYAKYFGLDDRNTTMENYFAKQQAQQQQVQQIQQRIDAGEITVDEARQQAVGLPYAAGMFKDPVAEAQKKRVKLQDQFDQLVKSMKANYQVDKRGRVEVWDKEDREWVRANKQDISLYERYNIMIANAQQQLDDLNEIAPPKPGERMSLADIDRQSGGGGSNSWAKAGKAMGRASKYMVTGR